MKQQELIIPIIITAIIAGGAGFFGGTKYQQTKQPQAFPFGNGRGKLHNAG